MQEKTQENLQEKQQENKMGTMPIGKLIATMSAPLVASMLFQALYNIMDSMFVAMVSQDALNAVSLAFPLQVLMIAFATGTGVGINALLSRSLGAKRFDQANEAANTGIFVYILTSIAFLLIGLFLPRFYFHFQTSNQQIVNYGVSYTMTCMGFSFCLFGQVCGERLLQATGRTNLSMISQITGAVVNTVLDPIMIFGLFGFPRLEVLGAAVATVIGQGVAAVIAFILNVKKNPEITLKIRQVFHPVGAIITEIYRIGIPSIIMQAVSSVMNTFLNKILIGFTEAATAAFGAYYKIQSFIFMPVFGMNNAIVPIVAYNYGAKKYDRLKKAVKYGIVIAVCIMTIGLILFETIPGLLLGIFSPTPEMLAVGTRAFRIIGIHFPVAGFCIVTLSVCQALGKPVYSLFTSLIRQLLVLLPAAYLLSLTGVLDNVWFAFLIAEVASMIASACFLKRVLRGLKD